MTQAVLLPRSIRLPLLAIGGGTLLYTFLVPFAPPAILVGMQIVVMLSVNGFAIWAMRARAIAAPAESRGWNCLALGFAIVVLGNFVMMAGALSRDAGATLARIDLGMMVVAGLIQARGIYVLPWTRSPGQRRLLHLLGSLIFVASIVVLFWMLEVWQGGFRGSLAYSPSLEDLVRLGNSNVAIRSVFMGGVAVFVMSERPQRVFGPGGVVMLAALLMIISVTGSAHAVPNAGGTPGGALWITLLQVAPLMFGLAAWGRQPLEPMTVSRLPEALSVVMQYLPFVIVGIFLARVDERNAVDLAWSLAAFLAISFVVVYRQAMLFRALRSANRRLEERVVERTNRLERLQAVMLRTERTNTLAMLGAGLAHDLNNILQTIGMSVELMRLEEAKGKRSPQETIDDIVTGTQEAGRLTQRLMSFARDEMASVERTPVDIHEAVSSHEDLLKMLLPRRTTLRLSLEAPGERLNLPATLLEQALVNLVANARDAMPDGGVVSIRVRTNPLTSPRKLLIEVSDTGQGIDPAIQGSIFDSFFTTKAQHGTGIGLASVRAMMESVGGSVCVKSEPGHGATFTLAFPIETPVEAEDYAATGESAATAASSSPAV